MTDQKQWCVVEFDDGVQIVPNIWILDEKSYWPAFKSNLRYEKAVKNFEPALDTWSLYPIKRILGIFDNYDRANSSDEELEDESVIKALKPFPQPVLLKRLVNPTKETYEAETPKSSTINGNVTSCQQANLFDEGVIQNICKEIQFIKVNIIKIQQTLEVLTAQNKDNDALQPNIQENFTMQDYPLTTMAALTCAEKKLSDTTYYQYLKVKLGQIGGYKLDEIVKLILKRRFDDQLAAQFTATRVNALASNASDQEIVDCIKNWSRHASARSKNNRYLYLLYFIKLT
nr:unnamed protein product [Callosobruchus analis]